MPVPVIETNVRSVFIHFFFQDKEKISDKDILPLIEKALDAKNPREWYWAVFDYGAELKKSGNPSRKSAHHAKQSKFEGSHRQKRAVILKTILEKARNIQQISNTTGYTFATVSKILSDLEKDGFIKQIKGNSYAAL